MSHKIKLYNSLKGKSETFIPIDENCISMYVCGPTVYDFIHIGNARPIVVFDTLYRLLKDNYPQVNYVRNITDIDDKIIKRAQEKNISTEELVESYSQYYHEDIKALNTLIPTTQPKATDHIKHMIEMIKALISKGNAYESEGHVLFSVESTNHYGQLSHRKLEDMIAGSRVEVEDYKKHPADFVLWKPSTKNQPSWESPWSAGRPGWHIECSAMANHYLGKRVDIHGGGQDLLFPHHENERIQSCCANNVTEFANYWLHNGYVMTSGEKMSKSLGNISKPHDLLKKHSGETLRLVLLSTHYRKPLEWTDEALKRAEKTLDKFYDSFRRYQYNDHDEPLHQETSKETQELMNKVEDALCDDLNTPLAFSYLHKMLSQVHITSGEVQNEWLKTIHKAGKKLGLFQQNYEQWFGVEITQTIDIESLIQQRNQARTEKKFKKADDIRKHLLDNNIVIEDTGEKTIWHSKK